MTYNNFKKTCMNYKDNYNSIEELFEDKVGVIQYLPILTKMEYIRMISNALKNTEIGDITEDNVNSLILHSEVIETLAVVYAYCEVEKWETHLEDLELYDFIMAEGIYEYIISHSKDSIKFYNMMEKSTGSFCYPLYALINTIGGDSNLDKLTIGEELIEKIQNIDSESLAKLVEYAEPSMANTIKQLYK